MNNNVHIATYQDAAKALANTLPAFPLNVVVRLGGTKRCDDYPVQINTVAAIENSVNKLVQKNLLLKAKLATLPLLMEPKFPCVVKGIVRSCGTKVFVANNQREFTTATTKLKDVGYLIEPLFDTTSEYRLHCTRKEVFFTVKKHKRNPADIIVTHDNHYNTREFLKPRLWKEIQAECLKAMQALDLDIACFDVLYCSTDNNKHTFVIAEANTNPELLANTYKAYNEILITLINEKLALLPKKAKVEAKLTEAQKYRTIQAIINNEYWLDNNGEVLSIKL